MMLTLDQPQIQQYIPSPSTHGNTSGLVDSLARESVFGGQWSSAADVLGQPTVRQSPPAGQNRRSPSTIESKIILRHDSGPLGGHIRKARAKLAELVQREQWAEQNKEFQKALEWLADNRQRYAGQWIALRGAKLLAAGTTAVEVYARVRGQHPPALVVKVEPQELPFAGW